MKANRFLRSAGWLLLLVVVTIAFLPGTGAKYVATAVLSASARVAQWKIELTGPAADSVTVYSNASAAVSVAQAGAGATASGNVVRRTFTVTNSSEVAADIALYVASSNVFGGALGAGSFTAFPNNGLENLGRTLTPTTGGNIEHTGTPNKAGHNHVWRFEPGVSAEFFIEINTNNTPDHTNSNGWFYQYLVYADAEQAD